MAPKDQKQTTEEGAATRKQRPQPSAHFIEKAKKEGNIHRGTKYARKRHAKARKAAALLP